jgi:hypothetical protein
MTSKAKAKYATPYIGRVHTIERMYEVNTRTAARILGFLNPRRLYLRAEIAFSDRLPSSGGDVIVSNHGRLDFDSLNQQYRNTTTQNSRFPTSSAISASICENLRST